MTADDRTETLSAEDVAAWLGCSPRSVKRKAADLGGFRPGKAWRFTRPAVEAYLERVTRVSRVTVLPKPPTPLPASRGRRDEYQPVFGARS